MVGATDTIVFAAVTLVPFSITKTFVTASEKIFSSTKTLVTASEKIFSITKMSWFSRKWNLSSIELASCSSRPSYVLRPSRRHWTTVLASVKGSLAVLGAAGALDPVCAP